MHIDDLSININNYILADTHSYSWVNWSNVEWKPCLRFDTAAQDSNLGCLSWELEVLVTATLRYSLYSIIQHNGLTGNKSHNGPIIICTTSHVTKDTVFELVDILWPGRVFVVWRNQPWGRGNCGCESKQNKHRAMTLYGTEHPHTPGAEYLKYQSAVPLALPFAKLVF